MAKDPVCGMKADEKTAAAKTVYKGITYYFCAQGCLREFLQEPEKYLSVRKTKNDLPSEIKNNNGHKPKI